MRKKGNIYERIQYEKKEENREKMKREKLKGIQCEKDKKKKIGRKRKKN